MKDPPRLQYYVVKLPTPSANAIDFHLLHERLEGKEFPKPLPMLQRIAIRAAPMETEANEEEEGEIPRLPTPIPMMVDPATLGAPTTSSPSSNSSVYESTHSNPPTTTPPRSPSVELIHPLPPKPSPTQPKLTGSNKTRLNPKRRSRGTLILSAGLASQTGKRTGPPPNEPPKSPVTRRATPYPTWLTAGPSAPKTPTGPRTICRPDSSAKCGQCKKMGHSLVFCREYQCRSCHKFTPGHLVSECKHWLEDRRMDDDYQDQWDETAWYNVD